MRSVAHIALALAHIRVQAVLSKETLVLGDKQESAAFTESAKMILTFLAALPAIAVEPKASTSDSNKVAASLEL